MSQENEPSQAHDLSNLGRLPVTYQDLQNYFSALGQANPFPLREETMRRIEVATGRPLLCYVAKTQEIRPFDNPYVDNFDLIGFGDLISSVDNDAADILIISNGGSAEVAERIVRLLRDVFKEIRFVVPHNAYSAATLICLSGDQLLMDRQGTLGPIDPQINGVPAQAIMRGFQEVQEILANEGAQALPAYMPLLRKYDLHLLEICKSAQELSSELARDWLSTYMLKCDEENPLVLNAVEFFSSFDIHKSHGRSIDRNKAREYGLPVVDLEELDLHKLVRSLHNQFEMFLNNSPFYKLFENAHGIHWGRQPRMISAPIPEGALGIPGITQ